MSTCSIYKGPLLLGSGSIANGATSVTGWTANLSRVVARKNVTVAITSSTHTGSSFNTRCSDDNGSGTLTLNDPNPFAT